MFNFKQLRRTEPREFTRFLVWKNQLIICTAMFFYIIAINGISGVQSTINKQNGLGLASLIVYNSSWTLTAFILPQMLIHYLTYKWTLTLGLALQIFYIALNAYPVWAAYIPAAVLGGIGGSLIAACSSFGISNLSQIYDKNENKSKSSQALFFGIYGTFLQLASILGNLLIALILKQNNNTNSVSNFNSTFDYRVCGAQFCPTSSLPPSGTTDTTNVYYLVGTFALCVVLSVLSSSLMNNLCFNEEDTKIRTVRELISKQFKSIRQQLFQLDQLLVIPITLLNASNLTFIWADFTGSFAACSAGISYIGWSSIVLTGVSALLSPLFGKLASKVSLQLVLFGYYALVAVNSIYMIFWQSSPSSIQNLFILAGLLGLIEAVNTPMPRALYGILFAKNEARYSAFTFFQGIGFILGYLISTFACTQVKIYFLLCLASICFVCDLIRLKRSRKNDQISA